MNRWQKRASVTFTTSYEGTRRLKPIGPLDVIEWAY